MTNLSYSAANWNQPPHNRHSFQHMSDLFATATIHTGSGQVRALESQPTDLSQIAYPVGGGRTEPLQHFLDTTFTDAFLVMRRGVILTEEYRNNMQADTPHLLNSVSKSFVGMAAGIAVDDGALDPNRLVSHYLPELGESAFRDTTVANALNMTSAVAYSEDYDSPLDDFWHEAAVVGWRPDLQTADAPKSLLEYCQRRRQTEQQEGEHFHYRTVLTNLCAALIAKATATPFVDFLTQRLWQPLGPQADANVVIDATGAPYMGAGMSACAADLARFGEMLRHDGYYNDKQIIPESWVRQTRTGTPELQRLFAASDYGPMLPSGHYCNQVWADPGACEMLCIGIHGQTIYINQAKELVCVKLSSQPSPANLALYAATYRALRALAAQL
jgi:CubicO group peptidase (beta-lactamase class C family)